jgi:hypothetical protein
VSAPRRAAQSGIAAVVLVLVSPQSWACSREPWSDNPCRRADLPPCYYDWTTAKGNGSDGRLGTCTSVLSRCEAEFQAILDMCKTTECSKDLIAYATRNLQMTEHALNVVCAHTGRP